MTPEKFYSTYQADDNLSPLSHKLISLVDNCSPMHVLDFGCGTGKHLNALPKHVVTCGLDISLINLIHANVRNNCNFLALGDQQHLGHLRHFDVVMTCSVLDHIEHIDKIITEFKRIAQKAIFLAETNDVPGEYYYPHDYESYGFVKHNFQYTGEDGANYFIWEHKIKK